MASSFMVDVLGNTPYQWQKDIIGHMAMMPISHRLVVASLPSVVFSLINQFAFSLCAFVLAAGRQGGKNDTLFLVSSLLKNAWFYEEMAIEMEHYRSRLSHYRNIGWDRGHMAPAATPEDTFNLCNVSPQDHTMNLLIWKRLEEWTQRLASSSDYYYYLWCMSRMRAEEQGLRGHEPCRTRTRSPSVARRAEVGGGNWKWIGGWRIEKVAGTDDKGWSYSNDPQIIPDASPSSSTKAPMGLLTGHDGMIDMNTLSCLSSDYK
jgi:hypothetical protein